MNGAVIDLGTQTLRIGDNANITGIPFDNTNYISLTTGEVRKLGAVSADFTNKVLPIGSNGFFTPVTIIGLVAGTYNLIGIKTGLTTSGLANYVQRYFSVDQGSTSSITSFMVNFSYDASEQVGTPTQVNHNVNVNSPALGTVPANSYVNTALQMFGVSVLGNSLAQGTWFVGDGPAPTHFRSVSSGDWNDNTSWEGSTDGLTWAPTAPGQYPGYLNASDVVSVSGGHIILLTNNPLPLGNVTVSGILNSNAGTRIIFGEVVHNIGSGTISLLGESEFRNGIVQTSPNTINLNGNSYFTTNNQTVTGNGAALRLQSNLTTIVGVKVTNDLIFWRFDASVTGTDLNSTLENKKDLYFNFAEEPMLIGNLVCTTPSAFLAYSRNGDQVVKAGTFSKVSLITSGTKTLLGDLTLGEIGIQAPLSFGNSGPINVSVSGLTAIFHPVTMAGFAHTFAMGGNINSVAGANIVATSGTIHYSSPNPQPILSGNYNNLEISGGLKTLSANTSVAGVLSLSGAVLQLGDYNLTASGFAPSVAYSSTNMIQMSGTANSGVLTKIGASDTDFETTYPIGTGTIYSPLNISNLSAFAVPSSLSLQIINTTGGSNTVNRRFSISTTGIGSVASLDATFAFDNTDKVGTPTSLSLYNPTKNTLPNGVVFSNDFSHYGVFGYPLDGLWVAESNAPPTMPVGHRGIYFDGTPTQNAVQRTFFSNVTDNMSMSAWVKLKKLPGSGNSIIMSNGDANLDGYAIVIESATSTVGIVIGGIGIISTNLTIPVNKWTHIAAVREAGVWKYYLNGTAGANAGGFADNYSPIPTPSGNFFIGNLGAVPNPFIGQIDEVRFFNSVRTPAQIAADMASTVANGALAYWNFDEANGATAYDLSGNGNNSTLSANLLRALRVTDNTDNGGAGLGSLRQAIIEANTDADKDYIDFSLPSGTQTIQPTSAYVLNNPVFIDGFTQLNTLAGENSTPNGANFGQAINAKLNVVINGALAPSQAFIFQNASNCLINGLVINQFPHAAIYWDIISAGYINNNNTISGCFIGTNRDGAVSNLNGYGFYSSGGAPGQAYNNLIGGFSNADRNLVNGSFDFNAWINGTITGNYIGIDASGTNYLSATYIQTIWTGSYNVITNNAMAGSINLNLEIGSRVTGNRLGTRADGTGTLTGNAFGIQLNGSSSNCIINNNIITNQTDGIVVNSSGTNVNNTISGNAIFGNTNSGILLMSGGNNNKPAPIITSAYPTLITGTCAAGDVVEVFNDTPQSGTTNQGRVFLGTATTTGTNWSFEGAFTLGDRITATATDGTNGTSAFSAAATVTGTTPGEALAFDGVDDNVVISHNASLNAFPITIETWFKTSNNSGICYLGMVNKYFSTSYNGWSLYQLGSELRAYYYVDFSNNIDVETTLAGISDGLWHHASFVADETGGKIYIDGVLKGIQSWIGTPGASTTTQDVTLGAYPGNFQGGCGAAPGYFIGELDQVRIWNRALCQTEIQSISSCETPSTISGLVANYKFNQGLGGGPNTGITTLNDASGNSNNGVFNNFNLYGATSNFVTGGGVVTGSTCTSTICITPTLLGLNVSSNNLCASSTYTLTLAGSGTFTGGNIFKIELSDNAGNFAAPTFLTSFTGILPNTIIGISIPVASNGSLYKIRASSNNPVSSSTISTDLTISSCNFQITSFSPLKTTAGSSLSIVGQFFGTLSANVEVVIGGAFATLTGISDNLITCLVPYGASTYSDIQVVRKDLNKSFSTKSLPQNQYLTITQNAPFDVLTAYFARTLVNTSGSYFYLDMGDLDKDGLQDVVISSSADVKIYRNTSTGTISFAAPISIAHGVTGTLNLTDVDADGMLDIVMSSRTSGPYDNKIYLFRNVSSPGSIIFQPAMNYATAGFEMGRLELGDINNDNRLDIASGNHYSAGNGTSFSVFQNNHTIVGAFAAASFANRVDVSNAALSRPSETIVVDFDGDGKADIATLNNQGLGNGPANLNIFRNLNTGGALSVSDFAAPVTYGLTGNPYGINLRSLDWNNDGKPDLVVLGGNTIVSIYTNASSIGAISFTLETSLAANDLLQEGAFALADIDGDGKVDILNAPTSGAQVGNFTIVKNKSTGVISFDAPLTFDGLAETRGLAVRDLNNDGVPEIIQVHGSASTSLSYYQLAPRPTLTSISVPGTALCAGTQYLAYGSPQGTFNAGNEVIVELSDAAGDFTAPIFLNSFAGAGALTPFNLFVTIPGNAIEGTNYKLRARTTNPVSSILGFQTLTVTNVNIDLTTGLVAYYPFNGNANDASGNGNNGVVNGATLATDRLGNANGAYYFDGETNFIETNIGSGFTDKITLSSWFKTSGQFIGRDPGIIANRSSTFNETGFNITNNGQTIFLIDDASANSTNIVSPFFYNDGKWHQITGVYDGTQMKLYLDNILVGTQSLSSNISMSSTFRIGHDDEPSATYPTRRFFEGLIDDIRIYNRALSDAEVAALYNGSQACVGTSFALQSPTIAGASYAWSGGSGSYSSISVFNPTITGAVAGTHIYSSAITKNGCSAPTYNTTVVVNALPTFGLLSTSVPPFCVNNPISIGVGGGTANTFTWLGSNLEYYSSRFITNPTFIPTVAGIVTASISGTNTLTGCVNTINRGPYLVEGIPTVTSFNPSAAIYGSTITINGNHFSQVTGIIFTGGFSAVPNILYNTAMEVVIPTGALTGVVTVVSNCGNIVSVPILTITPGNIYRTNGSGTFWQDPNMWDISTDNGLTFTSPAPNFPGEFVVGDHVLIEHTTYLHAPAPSLLRLGNVSISGNGGLLEIAGYTHNFIVNDFSIYGGDGTATYEPYFIFQNMPVGSSIQFKGKVKLEDYAHFVAANSPTNILVRFENGIINNSINSPNQFVTATKISFGVNNQTISGNARYDINDPVEVEGITVTQMINGNSFNVLPPGNINGTNASSAWKVGANSWLYYGAPQLMQTGTFEVSTVNSIVSYNAPSGGQIIYPTNYFDLNLSSAGTLAGFTKVYNNFTVSTPGELQYPTTATTMEVIGNVSGNGIINMSQSNQNHELKIGGAFSHTGTFNPGNGSVEYNGLAAQNVRAIPYYGLKLSGGSQKDAAGDIEVNNNLTLAGAIFNISTFGLNMTDTQILSAPGFAFGTTNMIATNGTGYIWRDNNCNDNTCSIGTYPFGVLTPTSKYLPIVINVNDLSLGNEWRIRPYYGTAPNGATSYITRLLDVYLDCGACAGNDFRFDMAFDPTSDIVGTPSLLVVSTTGITTITGAYVNTTLGIFGVNVANGQNAGTFFAVGTPPPTTITGFYRSVNSGNWDVVANWEVSTAAGAPFVAATNYPGQILSTDVVSITGGHVVTNVGVHAFEIQSMTVSGMLNLVEDQLTISGHTFVSGTIMGDDFSSTNKTVFKGLIEVIGANAMFNFPQHSGFEFQNGINFNGLQFYVSPTSGSVTISANPQQINNISSNTVFLNSPTFIQQNITIGGVCCGGIQFYNPVLISDNVRVYNNNVNTGINSTFTGLGPNAVFEQAPNSVATCGVDAMPMNVGIFNVSATGNRFVYNGFTGAKVNPTTYFELNLLNVSGTVASITGNTIALGDLSISSNAIVSLLGTNTLLEVNGNFKDFFGGLGTVVLNNTDNKLILNGANNTAAGIVCNSSSTVIYSGVAGQNIIPATYHNLIIHQNNIKTLSGIITATNLSITGGATLYTNTFQINGNAAGNMYMGANTRLEIGNPLSSVSVGFPTLFTKPNINLDLSSTVAYQSGRLNPPNTISGVPMYGNLETIATGGIAQTFYENTTIAGNLWVKGGYAEFNAPSGPIQTLDVLGNTTINGILQTDFSLNASPHITLHGNVLVNGFINLTNALSEVNINVLGSLTQNAGGNINYIGTNCNLTVAGDFVSNGNLSMDAGVGNYLLELKGMNNSINSFFSANSTSKVVYSGTNQNIAPLTKYNHLEVKGGGEKTITGATKVQGQLIMNGSNIVIDQYNLLLESINSITGNVFGLNNNLVFPINSSPSGTLIYTVTGTTIYPHVLPIGTPGFYSPVTISSLVASAYNGGANIGIRPQISTTGFTHFVQRYFNVTSTGITGLSDFRPVFSYNHPSEMVGSPTTVKVFSGGLATTIPGSFFSTSTGTFGVNGNTNILINGHWAVEGGGPDCSTLSSGIITGPVSICGNNNIILTVTGATQNYDWYDSPDGALWTLIAGNTNISTTSNNLSANTFYQVRASIPGCPVLTSTSYIVTVVAPPIPSVPVGIAICAGQSTSVNIGGVANATWLPANVDANPYIISPTTTTTYTFIGANLAGCTTSGVYTQLVNQAPMVSVAGFNQVCIGSTATLTASGALSYTWEPTASVGNTYSTVVAGNTTITVTGLSVNGCAGTTMFNITATSVATDVAYTVAANDICLGNDGHISINTENNVTYSALKNAIPQNFTLAGTGTVNTLTISSASFTAGANTFNIIAQKTGCTAVTLTGTANINANAPVNAATGIVTATPGTICGLPINIVGVNVNPSQAGVIYQTNVNNLSRGNTVLGTGGAVSMNFLGNVLRLQNNTINVVGAVTGCPLVTLTSAAVVYSQGAPTITGFSPISGIVGTTITILGNGFNNVISGTFAGIASAINITYINDQTLILTVPSGFGTGTLVLENTCGVSVASAQTFTIVPPAIYTSSLIGTTFCSGQVLTVPFMATAVYSSINQFTAQLSDDNGSFSTPTNIGSIISQTSGSVPVTIPGLAVQGTKYRIRIISNNPTTPTIVDNGIDITINPTPIVNTFAGKNICEGQSPVITLTSNVAGANYSWGRDGASTGSINIAGGSGAIFDQILYGSGLTIFNVNADFAGCNAKPIQFSININPVPSVNVLNNNPICSGNGTNINLSSAVGGTTFAWTTSVSGVSGASAGSGNSIVQTLNGGGHAIYIITATSGICTSAPVQAIVTVNSLPVSTNTVGAKKSSICSNEDAHIVISNSQNTIVYQAFIGGIAVSTSEPGNGGNLELTITSANLSIGSNTITVNALSPNCGNVNLTQTATVTLVSSPDATLTVGNNTPSVCSGGSGTLTVANAQAGVIYQAYLGAFRLGSAGTGTGSNLSLSFPTIGLNLGNNTLTVKANSTQCTGEVTLNQTASLNMNASPTVNPAFNGIICAGNATNITLSSNPAGASFVWTVSNPTAVTGAAGGSGNAITQTLNGSGTVDYNITPSLNFCTGAVTKFVVTVVSPPNVNIPVKTDSVCGGVASKITISNSEIGVTYALNSLALQNTGNGGNITFDIPSASLLLGENIFVINASRPTCNAVDINTKVLVLSPPQLTGVTVTKLSGGNCDKLNLVLSVPGVYKTYQWKYNNIKIAGANTYQYIPVADGDYTVEVGAASQCVSTSPVQKISLSNTFAKPVISNFGIFGEDTLLQSTTAATYQWYAGTKAIVGATAQSYRPLYNAKYRVKTNVADVCAQYSDYYSLNNRTFELLARQNFEQTDSTIIITAKNKINAQYSLDLVPNPAKGDVTLTYYSTNSDGLIWIKIYNLTGATVYGSNHLLHNGTISEKINLDMLTQGMYKVLIIDNDQITVKKLMVE
ncbi:MAG: LamG-like jellyroll fold domain-containing protein [Cytophagales bacterium]|nr:LamG-like jellyroll fold domain-containing protein [Cytophagales bacterium]